MKWKYAFKLILIIMGLLLLLNSTAMAVIANFNAGVIFSAIVAMVLIIWGIFFDRLYNIKWLFYILAIGFSLLICLVVFLAIYGQADNTTYTEDAVIVLGAGIKGDQVTGTLAYRLDKAVEYHHKNSNAVIVVSGGKGFQETITEALAMERYLISKGIPKDKIIKEENSTSTYTNFVNSKEILDSYFDRDYRTMLITNNFHIYRATLLSNSIGLDSTHYHAEIEWYTIPVSYLRECVAVIKTWIIGS